MSIRTIIEVNHDRLHELMDNPEFAQELWMLLASGDRKSIEHNRIPGIRVLADRHHSQSIELKVE